MYMNEYEIIKHDAKRLLYSCLFLSIYRASFLVESVACVVKKIFLSPNLAATFFVVEYLVLFTLIIYLRAHI